MFTNATHRHAWLRRRLPRPPQVFQSTILFLCVVFLIDRPKWIVLVVSTKFALVVLMALLGSEGV